MREVILICRGNQTNQSKKKETESCLRAENETEQHLMYWYARLPYIEETLWEKSQKSFLTLDDPARDVKELALSTTKMIFLTLSEKFPQ